MIDVTKIELRLLPQTSDNFMQIKVEVLGNRKKLSHKLSRRVPLDTHNFPLWFKVDGWIT